MPIRNDDDARKIAQAIANPNTPDTDRVELTKALEEYDATKTAAAPAPDPSMAGLTPQQQWDVGMGRSIVANRGHDVSQGTIRSPLTFVEGAGQLVTRGSAGVASGLEKLTGIEGLARPTQEWAQDYDNAVAGQRQGVSSVAIGTGEALAGVVPVSAQRAVAAGRSLSYMWSLLRGGATGAVVGSTQVADKDTSKLEQAAWGAAFPMAAQSIAGFVPTVRNAVANIVQRATQGRTAQAVRDAAQFFRGSQAVPDPAPYTIGQATGNPNLIRLENRARGPELTELNARQSDEAFARFDELAREAERAAGAPATGTGITRAVNATVDRLDQQMRNAKNRAWESGMARVRAAASGSSTRIPLNNLQDEYRRILTEDANPFNFNGSVLPRGVQEAFETLQNFRTTTGRAMDPNIAGVQTILAGLGQDATRGAAILSAADRRLEMYRQRLFAAINQDLDAVGALRDPAFIELQRTRQGYAVASQRLQRLEDDAINKLFGSEEAFASPSATLEKFYRLAPDDQRYAMDILSRRAPRVVDAMQSHRLSTALTAALEGGGPAQASRFNMDKFQRELFGGRDGLKDSPLWDAATRARLLEGAAHLRTIQNSFGTIPSGGSQVWPEELAINLVSRTPAFMARLATRAAYGRYGDQVLGTPEGLAALRTVTNVSRANPQAAAQAASWLLNLVNREEEESQVSAQ
jgi:hypothetical protein